MTRVHAFQIKAIRRIDWMFHDDPTVFIQGHNGEEHHDRDGEMLSLFKPEPGHDLIVWPHGLVTYRPEEDFLKDFSHLGGTVYLTELEALFQKGMLEGGTVEGPAKVVPPRPDAVVYRNAKAPLPPKEDNPTGFVPFTLMVKQVIPGVVPISKGFLGFKG